MTKRHLTRRQKWRIEKIQQERSTRVEKRDVKLQEELEGGEFGAEQSGLVIARFGVQAEVEDNFGESYRCHLRANLPTLVTGDKVIWRAGNQQNGVIVAVEPRISEICRPDSFGKLKTIAANVDLLVIVFAPLPTPYTNLIDRYLVAAKFAGIKPLLLLNKVDLINDQNQETISALLSVYKTLNYDVLEVSSQQVATLDHLRSILGEHTSVFVGQSGVGKSSLINTLLPDADLKTAALSLLTNKGSHTTTTARLFHLPDGGTLIDSPGIREFALTHINKEMVEDGFIEFHPFLGRCKFRNCQHEHEPGCALLQAVIDGKISQQRVNSYKHILVSLPTDNY